MMFFAPFYQVDSLYMQSLRGIRDIHESGVDEHSFSEVKCLDFLLSLILATISGFCSC